MIKKFRSFFRSSKSIDAICDKYHITRYTVNKDNSIDVDGSVQIINQKDLTKLPLKFREIDGSFNCSSNNLLSLEGCPEFVGVDFSCMYNELESISFCPREVGGNFDCSTNRLKDLIECPQKIQKDFNCRYNYIESLDGSPRSIGESFDCSSNEISSLKNCPEFVGGTFDCSDNSIYDFGDRYFTHQDFECSENPIDYIYSFNPTKEFIESLIENSAVRGKLIIKKRLIQSMEDSGLKIDKDKIEDIIKYGGRMDLYYLEDELQHIYKII